MKTSIGAGRRQIGVHQDIVISVDAGAEGTGAVQVRNKVEMFYAHNRGHLVLFARTMLDSGADLILGHGPHVPKALELYKGKAIAYSLGNFLGYRTLSTVGELGYSLILDGKMNYPGNFISGKIITVHLDRRGVIYLARYFRSVKLIRYLTKSNFRKTITIDSESQILK